GRAHARWPPLLSEPGLFGGADGTGGPFVVAAVFDIRLEDVHLVDVVHGNYRHVIDEHLRELLAEFRIRRGGLQRAGKPVEETSGTLQWRELLRQLREVEVVGDVEGRQRAGVLRQEAISPATAETHRGVATVVWRFPIGLDANRCQTGLHRSPRI